MDAAGLQNLFSQGNPFLAQMGEQAWNQDQAKAQQALLAAQGQEQRAQAMAPLEQAHSKATTGYNAALTDQIKDKMAGQLPAAKRLEQAMQEWSDKMSDSQRNQESAKIQQRLQWAEMAKGNGGVMPLEFMNNIPQEERKYIATPQAVAQTLKVGSAWYNAQPKVKEARAKEQADLLKAQSVANIGANARMAGSSKPTILKTIDSKLIALQDDLEEAKTPEEKQYVKDQIEYFQAYAAKKAQDAALAKGAGSPDLAGRLPTQTGEPTPTIAPPQRGGSPATPKPLTYKTPDDVKAAFKSGKLTKEQAIQLLQKEHGMQ